jgi:hypothetical protein
MSQATFTRGVRAGVMIVALAACFLASGRPLHGYTPNEYRAAAVVLLAKYVDWPAAALPSATITIGVLGKDPFGGALDRLSGKLVKGRRLVIRHLADLGELGNVQVLFISSSERERLPEILGAVRDSSVLTIAEIKRFAESGGIIGVRTQSNRLRFTINPAAAARARLRISSELLEEAELVRA